MAWGWLGHSQYLAAFLVGLLGGIHCLGMCGGIVGALTFSLPPAKRNAPATLFPILLAYNSGRISSYLLAGSIAGGVGEILLLTQLDVLRTVLNVLAAGFMIFLGLYLAGWSQGISRVENTGRHLWRYIEPFGRRFIPVDSAAKALPLGFVWGWLPCGLVYSVLFWALSAGSVAKGALLMLAFGLGTLPNLLLMGAAAARLGRLTRNTTVKRAAGLLVIALGILMLLPLLNVRV